MLKFERFGELACIALSFLPVCDHSPGARRSEPLSYTAEQQLNEWRGCKKPRATKYSAWDALSDTSRSLYDSSLTPGKNCGGNLLETNYSSKGSLWY